ncbi:MAG: ABC transporter ATP-binding protein [Candidatus Hodarchaeota archaeon]
MSKNLIVETKNLTKYYGKSRGIENLNLEIYKGEIFGLLGPNGAGKTTTIRVLLDLIRRTSGEAKVFGLDTNLNSVAIRQRLAYLPGELGLYPEKTGLQNLEYLLGQYKNHISKRRIKDLAHRLNLDLNRKIKELSKGNKQKVGIILALAPEVELLILDEPTSGLDPLITNDFYKMLHDQQEETGSTVLLSSHLLQEVEKVAHRVGVIREGALIEVATIQQLKRMALKEVKVEFANVEELKKYSDQIPRELAENIVLNETHISFTISRDNLPKALEFLSQMPIVDLDIESPDLEDIFIKYYQTGDKGLVDKSKKEIMEVE